MGLDVGMFDLAHRWVVVIGITVLSDMSTISLVTMRFVLTTKSDSDRLAGDEVKALRAVEELATLLDEAMNDLTADMMALLTMSDGGLPQEGTIIWLTIHWFSGSRALRTIERCPSEPFGLARYLIIFNAFIRTNHSLPPGSAVIGRLSGAPHPQVAVIIEHLSSLYERSRVLVSRRVLVSVL